MRQIINVKEKEILKKLTVLKREGNLKELQFARLLRKHLDTIALAWNTDERIRHNIAIFSEISEPNKDQWDEIPLIPQHYNLTLFISS